MQCPNCGGRGRVSATDDFGVTIRRYRRCPLCNHRWRTWEEKDALPVRAKAGKKIAQDDLFAKNDKDTKA